MFIIGGGQIRPQERGFPTGDTSHFFLNESNSQIAVWLPRKWTQGAGRTASRARLRSLDGVQVRVDAIALGTKKSPGAGGNRGNPDAVYRRGKPDAVTRP